MHYPHLEALHDLGNVPYDEALGPRTNKVNVLEAYGFTKGSNQAEIITVDYADGPADMQAYLSHAVDAGNYSALLFRDGKWESMGGCPVVYVMNRDSIAERLTFDAAGTVAQVNVGGSVFAPGNSTKVNIYTRRRSVGATLEGFDNYDTPLDISLGGGFRLQIDGIGYEAGTQFLTMSAHFSFNDYGSRVLAKESETDARVPMATRSFRIPIIDGRLVFPVRDIRRSEVTTVGDAIGLVLAKLFTEDGTAISSLTRDLLSVRPVIQIHQFEGIYGVTDEHGVSAEVIDFDGLDTFDLSPSSIGPTERLAGGQLVHGGYITTLDRGTRVAYFQQQSELRDSLAPLPEAELVSDAVKQLASLRPGEDINAYTSRLNAYGRLARSISYCNVEWSTTNAPGVTQTIVNGWTLTKVAAAGFEAAFIEHEGKIFLVSNAREIYELMRQVFGNGVLKLFISLSREGD